MNTIFALGMVAGMGLSCLLAAAFLMLKVVPDMKAFEAEIRRLQRDCGRRA